ncbi:hypothetical protein MLD38_017823 [Melastoma candidum]|uniref:Uncharacterized protein n=1 Tax=Melastoma candidum TaxID=119954 RepID=A0ACB9QSG3_9MYRT|nr:hypothetical protein MLD38_017823 [Melastoma candidum]
MALLKFLVALLVFSSLQVSSLSQTTTSSADRRLDVQALLSQICTDVENQNLCLSNVQDELNRVGRPPHDQNSVLRAAIKATMDEAKQAIEMISKFTVLSVTYREQVAIEDCKELLDFSVTELAWSLGEMERIRSGSWNIHYGGNLKAWLSAALSNQDTCLEGFEGTDGHLQSFVRGSLKQVTQLIGNVLTLYSRLHSLPFRPPRGNATSDAVSRFPSWMNEGDQQLLTSNPLDMHVDAIVASDGRGHYQTITDAINEAPAYSGRRYVIHIKKGVYSENIDMKKKKTNIMLVGDGIGATIVTGNRNFMQGMTTFRTATVAVSGRGFIARDMTFRNTAGPENHQAVALRVDSDQSAFYHLRHLHSLCPRRQIHGKVHWVR